MEVIYTNLYIILAVSGVFVCFVVLFKVSSYLLSRAEARAKSKDLKGYLLFHSKHCYLSLLFYPCVYIIYYLVMNYGHDDFLVKYQLITMKTILSLWLMVVSLRMLKVTRAYFSEMKVTDSHVAQKIRLIETGLQVLELIIVIVFAMSLMQVYQVSFTALIAVSGFGAAALAFASKNLLANFFGGLYILTARPFQKGDYIGSPDKKIEGTVELFTWTETIIRKSDMTKLIVPNSLISSIIINNISDRKRRVFSESIVVSHMDYVEIGRIVSDVHDVLSRNKLVDNKRTHWVDCTQASSEGHVIEVYALTTCSSTESFMDFKRQILIEMVGLIKNAGGTLVSISSS